MRYTETMNERDATSRQPARFKFKYSPLLIFLFILGFCLSAACIGFATWRLVLFIREGDLASYYDWIIFILLYLVSILFLVIGISMLIRSEYILTDSELITQFGIIRQRYALKKIMSVHLFKGANKLAVYFDDFHTNYIVIVVKDSWYNDFIRELTERNEHIAFTFSTAEEEAQIKKKK